MIDTSSEHRKYLQQLEIANRMVEDCLSRQNEFDKHDLFRIAMNSFKTSEEKLQTGVRRIRRMISGF